MALNKEHDTFNLYISWELINLYHCKWYRTRFTAGRVTKLPVLFRDQNHKRYYQMDEVRSFQKQRISTWENKKKLFRPSFVLLNHSFLILFTPLQPVTWTEQGNTSQKRDMSTWVIIIYPKFILDIRKCFNVFFSILKGPGGFRGEKKILIHSNKDLVP